MFHGERNDIKNGQRFMAITKRIECIVSGRVQMVMYRDFATRSAKRLGVRGSVRNEKDGTVRIIAEGEEQILHEYIARLHKGSIFAHVQDVRVTWGDPTGEFSVFTICY